MKRPVVLLDCDGVLADFVSAVLAFIRDKTGHQHTPEEIRTWEIFDHVAPELREECYRAIKEKGFCARIAPLPGATDAVERLKQIASVFVVTSPWNSATWMSERTEWLHKHFGLAAKQVIHASNKELTRGDYFLDDKGANVARWLAMHRDGYLGVGLLWDTPHNRHEAEDLELPRVRSWEEFLDRVARFDDLVRQQQSILESIERQLAGTVLPSQRQLLDRMKLYQPVAEQYIHDHPPPKKE